MDPLLGRWPWPRYIYHELLDFLTAANARSVIFDILFTETQKQPLCLDESAARYDDQLFAQGTKNFGAAIHAFNLSINKLAQQTNTADSDHDLPQEVIDRFSVPLSEFKFKSATDYFLPYEELLLATDKLGFVDVDSDKDSIFRQAELLRHFQEYTFPSLSMAAALSYFNTNKVTLDDDNNLRIHDRLIPLAQDGRYLIKTKMGFQYIQQVLYCNRCRLCIKVESKICSFHRIHFIIK